MSISERQQHWRKNKALTPEKLALARLVLEEVLDGEDGMLAVRDHPLPQGGMLGKSMLVAAYTERGIGPSASQTGGLFCDTIHRAT